MPRDGRVVEVERCIEFRDIEQTLSAQAVAEIARVQCRRPIHGQFAPNTVETDAIDIGGFLGPCSCREEEDCASESGEP